MIVFYIGSAGPLSNLPFEWLLQSEHRVCGVGIDRHEHADFTGEESSAVIRIEHNELVMQARRHNVPVIDLPADARLKTIGQIRRLNPDLILVSCYAHKIPAEILAIPRYGALNCHPSRLPAYRGPVPLFWQFRNGEKSLAMTLHLMSDQWDAGDIIARADVPITDGLRAGQLNQVLATALCELLEETLGLFPGSIRPQIQEAEHASYQGYPRAGDFQVRTEWSARRIFNFMRATEHLGYPYPCQIEDKTHDLKHALLFSEDEAAELMPSKPGVLHLRCNPGLLVASYYQ